MPDIVFHKIDEVYGRIEADTSILMELRDAPEFTFFAPGYKFHPQFKAGRWDGKIRLVNVITKMLYIGLEDDLRKFATDNDYSFTTSGFEEKGKENFDVLKMEMKQLVTTREPRDYQVSSVQFCLENHRGVVVSATGSGKSLSIYYLTRFYSGRTLIVVPTITLLEQMRNDFISYGCEDDIYLISGTESVRKMDDSPIVIGTYQTLFKQSPEFFENFSVVVNDECHKAKNDSITKLMQSAKTVKYRFGFTGSLDGSLANEKTIRGLFGNIFKAATSSELIEQGILAEVDITAVCLKYSDQICKSSKGAPFQTEMDFVLKYKGRLNFICNMARSLKGNTLILFNRLENGKEIYEQLKTTNDNVFYVAGDTDVDERERIRQLVNNMDVSITVGSTVWIEGVNIPNIDNIVMCHPYKSVVRVVQSIGRGLRKTNRKSKCKIYDIVDDLCWKKHKNFMFRLYLERRKIYAKERFPFQQKVVRIND